MAHKVIIEISGHGDRISLDDSSMYAVATGDIPKAICWYGSQRVVVSRGRGGRVRIKNLDTFEEESISATPIIGSADADRADGIESDDEAAP